MMDAWQVRDNPVLVKHIRARLRVQLLLPWVAIVGILSLLIVYAAGTPANLEGAFFTMVVFQCVILQLVGTAQVLTSVSRARESGMLEFHRISPQRAGALALGFLLGAPIREYALFACTLPFAALISIKAVGAPHAAAILVDILIVTLLYHAGAVLAGLMLPKGTGASSFLVVVLVLFFFSWPLAGVLSLTYLTVVPTVTAASTSGGVVAPEKTAGFFGVSLPLILVSLVHQLLILFILFAAASRKMRHETAYPVSKAGALVVFSLLALLGLGDLGGGRSPFFSNAGAGFPLLILCYALFFLGLILSGAVTPDAGAFARGVRRARKLGLARLSAWDDHSANWASVAGLFALFVAAGLAGVALLRAEAPIGIEAAFGTAVCAMAFFALTSQSFHLLFRKNAKIFFVLLLFLLWGLPLLLGMLLAIPASYGGSGYQVMLSISPLAGIGMATAESIAARTTALAASGFLALCSVALCWWAVRRARAAAESIG